jgi:membrane fusion protein, multidrug efflux system
MHKILLSLLLITLISSCGGDNDKNTREQLVKTMIIGENESGSQRVYPGRVIAGQKVDLSFQQSGTLRELPVKEGMKVAQNDLLARLDDRDFQNRFDAASAQLNTVETNFKRGEKLVKNGTIAQATFDELRSKYETAKSNANIAEKALKDTRLFAPFSGLIARRFVDNFQEVQAKEKILSLQNVDDIDILIDVPEQDLINRQQVREGNEAQELLQNGYIKFDALGNRRFETRIKEYATESDPNTQTYRVTLTMKAPSDVMILPGMTAKLVVTKNTNVAVTNLSVPVNAVAVDADGNFYVWIVDQKDMTVHKKLVEAGELRDENMRVVLGLESGDCIVIAGVPYLEEGMKVRLFTNEY